MLSLTRSSGPRSSVKQHLLRCVGPMVSNVRSPGLRKHSFAATRRIFQCSACRVQTSANAGTIFHKSTTPLIKWFLAIYQITGAKNDNSGLELARQLGAKWDTAWLSNRR